MKGKTLCDDWRYVLVPKPIKIEIVQEGNLRFDRSEERVPIVKLPRRQRFPPRPYWHWNLNKSRKKGF
jgi:hypothetical protein